MLALLMPPEVRRSFIIPSTWPTGPNGELARPAA
jgi:hypothetical protein